MAYSLQLGSNPQWLLSCDDINDLYPRNKNENTDWTPFLLFFATSQCVWFSDVIQIFYTKAMSFFCCEYTFEVISNNKIIRYLFILKYTKIIKIV